MRHRYSGTVMLLQTFIEKYNIYICMCAKSPQYTAGSNHWLIESKVVDFGLVSDSKQSAPFLAFVFNFRAPLTLSDLFFI